MDNSKPWIEKPLDISRRERLKGAISRELISYAFQLPVHPIFGTQKPDLSIACDVGGWGRVILGFFRSRHVLMILFMKRIGEQQDLFSLELMGLYGVLRTVS